MNATADSSRRALWSGTLAYLAACLLFGFLDAVSIRLQGVPLPLIGVTKQEVLLLFGAQLLGAERVEDVGHALVGKDADRRAALRSGGKHTAAHQIEELITEEMMVVTFSRDGYVKRTLSLKNSPASVERWM